MTISPPGVAAGSGPNSGRYDIPLERGELRRCARRRDTERIDPDHVAGAGVEEQRLRLPAPSQRVPHRAGGRKHRAGGVQRVSTFLEGHRSGGRGEGLAGDRDPVAAGEHRLDESGARESCVDAGGGRSHNSPAQTASPLSNAIIYFGSSVGHFNPSARKSRVVTRRIR